MLLLHPGVIANLLASLIISTMVLYSSYYGLQILRNWDIESGSELQLVLERKTYLVSTILSYVFALQLLSLFMYVFTADNLHPLFVGAMCAAGTLNLNAFGYPTLLLKMLNFILAGLWLILNHTDNQGYDYPLIKKKYALLAMIAPLILIETLLEFSYFLNLRADVITSCCGSLFSSEQGQGLGSDMAALPPGPMLWFFYGAVLITLGSGFYYYRKGRGGYFYSFASIVLFLTSIVSIISFISLYIYELPTHHCPFCIVMPEYDYIGYLLYIALFIAVVAGTGIATLIPLRGIESLREVIPALTRKLTLTSLVLFFGFASAVTYRIAISNLIM
ncbi:hypothetical protein [Methylococcus sp. Mc7]|uniref:hypothetical protein n=1 Tax=Methylococcus sp. Mc7 TaxID=2860258 RepID=UPI00210551DB|nr:hypothetical protein [Methylococcus sp. Mc7]